MVDSDGVIQTSTMRALGLVERPSLGTTASALRWVDVPVPIPSEGRIRVRVAAASLNIDDVHIAEGTPFGGVPMGLPRPTVARPVVPGLDVAGVVDALGPGVDGFEVGDHVFGVVYPWNRIGALAPLTCDKASHFHALPNGWTFTEGAAIVTAGATACVALQTVGDVDGKRCVVVGASGGIGGVLVQALAAAGATQVVGVCSAANTDRVLSLGAHVVVDYTRGPWGQQLAEDSKSYDLVFDCVGGMDTEAEAIRILRPDGHLLTLCGPERFPGDRRLSAFELTRMMGYIAWRTIFSRVKGPRYTLASGSAPDWAHVQTTLIDRNIRPSIEKVYPFRLSDVAEAIRHLSSHRNRGKLVVDIGDTEARPTQ